MRLPLARSATRAIGVFSALALVAACSSGSRASLTGGNAASTSVAPAALTIAPSATSSTVASGDTAATTTVVATGDTLPEDSTTTAPDHTSPPQTATPSLAPQKGLWVQNPSLTPGVTDPRVTQATIGSTICVSGYTKTVRHVTSAMKTRVYHAYGIMSHAPGSYEVDHLISLELGGTNDFGNLWPEPYFGPDNAHDKDYWENELHRQVCHGTITLARAQYLIVHWWVLLGATGSGTFTGGAPIAGGSSGGGSTGGGSTGGGSTSGGVAPTTTAASSGTRIVTPGAYCSPIGDHGVSAAGVSYVCATTKADGTPYAGGRAHWRRG